VGRDLAGGEAEELACMPHVVDREPVERRQDRSEGRSPSAPERNGGFGRGLERGSMDDEECAREVGLEMR
jgi:hypothetical protein